MGFGAADGADANSADAGDDLAALVQTAANKTAK
eukprot:SAG31_NODE_34967_length_327_cov_1.109649_2_plen_33_part_01